MFKTKAVHLQEMRQGHQARGEKWNPYFVYLGGLRKTSRRTIKFALQVIVKILGKEGVDPENLAWWKAKFVHGQVLREHVAGKYSISSANLILSVYRKMVRISAQLGHMTFEEAEKVASVEKIKGTAKPAGRHLKAGEIMALFQACGETPLGARNAAILGTLYGGGLRREELVDVQVEEFDLESGELEIRQGKWGKAGKVYLTGGAREAMEVWLMVRGFLPGYLFTKIKKYGADPGKGLTGTGIYLMLRELGKKAGVEQFSPHDLRRTFVGDLLDAGADLSTVQKLARHESPKTTARYDRRGAETEKAAAELLHVPYRAKMA